MRKKLIKIFLFTFFLSTTGLPISLHYCQMQGIMSLSDCEICAAKEMDKESSCCEKENNYPIQLKNDTHDNCCELKIIDSSVKDNFTVTASEWKAEKNNFVINYILTENSYNYKADQFYYNFTDTSPPLTQNKIYLLNSIFLI